MSVPVLIFIHGIGEHPPGWSGDAIGRLNERAADYSSMEGNGIVNLFHVVEISYDAILLGLVKRWAEEVQGLKTNALYSHVEPALDWLDGSAHGDFVWTHIADVILYMSSAIRNAVASAVAAVLGETIVEMGTANRSYNILAHSMGTSVAAEAVTALATPQPDPEGWPGLPSGFRFDNVFMLANTSRLLQRDSIKAYTSSRLLPASVQSSGLCVNYWNFAHRFDPIPAPRRFELTGPPVQGYMNFMLDHYYDTNLHALTHYLEHPLVHGAVFRAASRSHLPVGTWRAAIRRYQDKADKMIGGRFDRFTQVQNYLDRLEQHPAPNLLTAINFAEQIGWIVRRMREMQ